MEEEERAKYEVTLIVAVREYYNKAGGKFILRDPGRGNGNKQLWRDQWGEICKRVTLKCPISLSCKQASEDYYEVSGLRDCCSDQS